jgi:O-antigen/teichoic acid export membrane protein
VGSQVLFAEASRPGQHAREQLVKALKWVYGFLLPAIVIVLAAAPLVLRVFGPGYAAAGTGCLRWLALSTLFTGGIYLLEAVLIARDRMPAYIFMNGAGSLLALGFVAALVSRGITAAAFGWAVARALSLLLCVLVVNFSGGGWRHRPLVRGAPGGPADDTNQPGGRADQPESAGRRAAGTRHQVPDAAS